MAWYHGLSLLVAQVAPAEEVGDDSTSVPLRLILALAVIVGSFALGAAIARGLKMADYSFRIGVILFALIASLAVNIFGWPPKRGIDLSGGVVLIYEVDRELTQPNSIQAVVDRVNEVLNSQGGEKLAAQPVSADRFELVLPEGAEAAKIERAIADLKNSANLALRKEDQQTRDGKTKLVYRVDQQTKDLDMNKLIAAVSRRINPSGVKEVTIRQYGAEQLEVIIPEVDEREVDHIKRLISKSGSLSFRILANQNDDKQIIAAAEKTAGRDVYIGGKLVARWVKAAPILNLPPDTLTVFRPIEGRGREVLVKMDVFNVDGGYLSRAGKGYDQGRPAVNFSFNTAGAEKFGQLTSRNLPDPATGFKRQLGIILDDEMLSAPSINSTIHGDGQITGAFSDEDVDFLVGVLNAGSLPATLRSEPITEQRLSAQLGSDTIHKGSMAMILSTVAILVFMAVYYRFCGLVADLAVVLNVVITVALMILIKAAFTLPGLAGLVLTVGMAVDANVLIYERMREESERGASLRMALRNGFSRAMATIIDSHVTTIVSGIVLYIVGTDQIRGFAVTLVLGLLMSLFTAVFVSRVIFDIAERKRWITRLSMMHIIKHTNIDFIRWRVPAIMGSVVIILVGLVAGSLRRAELLDIDFTGGSSVHLWFAEGKPHDIADIRETVASLPDVAVSSIGEENLEFKIDTSERDIKQVQALLQEKFPDSLRTYSMSYGPLAKIEKETEGKGPNTPASVAPPATPAAEKPAEQPPAEDAEKPPANEEKTSAASPVKPRAALQLAAIGHEAALAALLLAQDEAAKASEPSQPETPPANQEQGKPSAGQEKPAAAAAQEKSVGALPSLVGGTRVTLNFAQNISHAPLQDMVQHELDESQLQNVIFDLTNPKYQAGSDAAYADWTLTTSLSEEQTKKLLDQMKTRLASTPVFPSSNQIGGKVAGDTQLMALYALFASMFMIVIYIWIRFQNVIFGLAAILALVHDVLVTVAFLAMSFYLSPYLGFLLVDPFKISLSVVASLLTIVGYSINDTIVVFDRIREVRGKSPDLNEQMINDSVNQTLSRTLLTSGTVFIASVILYFVGGAGIHAFAYSMIVGVIAGTYSSIYIAAPVLLWLKRGGQPAVAKAEKLVAGGKGSGRKG